MDRESSSSYKALRSLTSFGNLVVVVRNAAAAAAEAPEEYLSTTTMFWGDAENARIGTARRATAFVACAELTNTRAEKDMID